MNNYSNAWAIEQQALAFDGDEDACWRLITLLKPYCMVCLSDSDIERKDYEDVWSTCVSKLAVAAASGNALPYWFAYGKAIVRNTVYNVELRERKRRNAEERYLEGIRTRYRDAYPAVRECVELLEPMPHDIIMRMYFRPVRQSILSITKEYCATYWSIAELHRHTLAVLRGMLIERGITHA